VAVSLVDDAVLHVDCLGPSATGALDAPITSGKTVTTN
jgi:hypothetical protein